VSEFFFVHLLDREGVPVAYGAYDPDRDKRLVEPGWVERWATLELQVTSSEPTDYLANNVGVRLCSARLRDAVELNRGADDELQWLEARVVDASGVEHEYFVLHLPLQPDVLDPQRTIRAGGWFVVKPVLSVVRVGSHRVLSFPGAATRLIVSETVKAAIVKEGCTGVDFSKVAAV
jgi:hypothetical protein